MSVFIENVGLDKLINDMDGYVQDLHKSITKSINKQENKVIEEARSNHRYDRKSGNLQKATMSEYSRSDNLHTVEFFINDAMLSTDGDRSYGTFIHEGTYQGYEQSPIAPFYTSSVSASGSGWEADPFLYNAIKNKWRMDSALHAINNNMKKKYERK